MIFLTNASFTIRLISACGLLIWRRPQLEKMISHMAEHATMIEARSLVCSLTYFEALIAIQVTYFVVSRIWKIESERGEAFLEIASAFLEYWIMMTCIFYYTVLQVMYLHVKRHMDVVMLHASTKHLELALVCKAAFSITQSVEEFDRLMSPLPFLWFRFGMVSAAGSVYGIIKDPSDFMALVLLMQDYLPPILVVCSATRVFERGVAMAASICRQVTSNKSLETRQSILMLRELDSLKAMRLSGMGFFSLDKSFLLSYVGSVLTYAALIAGFTREQHCDVAA